VAANKLGEALATHLYNESYTLCDLEVQIDSLPDNGNAAFNQTRPESMLAIMLAAHDEPAHYIGGLLPKLEKRIHDASMPPTSVIISCNAPEGQQGTVLYNENIDAIRSFQAQNSDTSGLAVSFFEIAYPKDTTQGRRRRDLATTAMMHCWRTYSPAAFPDKMSFMMLDVDTEDIRPRSLSTLHAAVMRGEQVVGPQVNHAVDPAYPRLGKVLRFEEALYAILPSAGWDGYLMFDLATLADKGNYPASQNMAEVQRLIVDNNLHIHIVPQARMITSSRRLHTEFLAGQTQFHKCWSSFSATETYRLGSPDQDISAGHMRKTALESVNFVATHGLKVLGKEYETVHKLRPLESFSKALSRIATQVRVANSLLGMGIEDSEEYKAMQEAAHKYRII
jgi:hypothetical protein